MSNPREVVKNALVRLQREGRVATPDAYREAFYLEARLAGLSLTDNTWQEEWLGKFGEKIRAQLQTRNIKNSAEFIAAIAEIVGQLEKDASSRVLALQQKEFLETLLQILPSTEHTQLVHKLVHNNHLLGSPEEARNIKEGLFRELKDVHALHKEADSLPETAEESATIPPTPYEEFVAILQPFLTPSISSRWPSEAIKARTILERNPALLLQETTKQQLGVALNKRIEVDKNMIAQNGKTLGEVIDALLNRLSAITATGTHYQGEISEIAHSLQQVDISTESLDHVKNQLLGMAKDIDSQIHGLNEAVEEKKSEIEALSSKVEELNQELFRVKQEVSFDILTQVYTRRYMEEESTRLESLFVTQGQSYAVVFFDVDFFKKVNDTYGHATGDKILAAFGQVLRQSVRDSDVPARYGGEEFVVLLPNMDTQKAVQFAERIRKIAEKSTFIYRDVTFKVTVSAGVASRTEANGQETVFELADSRLYQAKQNGRNQVQPAG